MTTTADIIDRHRLSHRWVGDGVTIQCVCGHESQARIGTGPFDSENNSHRDAERMHAQHIANAITDYASLTSDSPDLADGGFMCAAIEKEAERDWQDAGKVGNATYWRERAEKAERALFDQQTNARCWMKTSESWQVTAEEWEARATRAEENVRAREEMINRLSARAEQPRGFTADDIEVALHDCLPTVVKYNLSGMRIVRLAEDMHAALTPPPAEDPEVVAIADVLGDFAVADEHTGKRDDMVLARRLHERGVRVTGGEQS